MDFWTELIAKLCSEMIAKLFVFLLDTFAENDYIRTILQDLQEEFFSSGLSAAGKTVIIGIANALLDVVLGDAPRTKREWRTAVAAYVFAQTFSTLYALIGMTYGLTFVDKHLPHNIPTDSPIVITIWIVSMALFGFVSTALASIAVSDVELPGTLSFFVIYGVFLVVRQLVVGQVAQLSHVLSQPMFYGEYALPYLVCTGMAAVSVRKVRSVFRSKQTA